MSDTERFLLPDLGEGLTEASIVSWLVEQGDVVAVDQPVVEVESAKSVVELPSPYAGRVQELHVAVGDVVQRDAPLLTIAVAASVRDDEDAEPAQGDEDAEPAQGDKDAEPAQGADDSEAAPNAELVPGTALRADGGGDAQETSGAVLVGYGVTERTRRPGRTASGRFGRGRRQHTGTSTRSPVVSPIVRKLARDNGLDAAELTGSGPDSLVRREDVEAAIAARGRTSASAPSTGGEQASDLRIPIVGMRRIIAEHLTQSRQTIPEATIWLDVDATELMHAKERLAATTGERYSVTALVARFVVAGLRRYPVLNASVDETAHEIVQHADVNLGLAAQTGRGLMVPVVRGAQAMTLNQLRDAVTDLVTHARAGDYPPSALAGGTFTLNNYGSLGVDGSSPIINHPEVAMLGLGRLMQRPWVVDGELAVRTVATLSLVFDHRVCDGDTASGFLTYVARCIQEPLVALADL
jgi:pyruvate dehydrogenase E2 component (dihydrolipoamide acetyltransferase)